MEMWGLFNSSDLFANGFWLIVDFRFLNADVEVKVCLPKTKGVTIIMLPQMMW